MNLNQLRAFHAVARTRSFSKAAKELFVTEPAVYMQVQSLEQRLGFKLFNKLGKDLEPTEVGRLLFNYAEKIFGMVQDADRAITELRALKSGELRIGSAKCLVQHLMPLVVSSFQDFYPGIKILLSEGSSDELSKGILNHQYELAVVTRIPYPDPINVIPFSKDKVIVVVSPESKLSRVKEVSMEELSDQPLIWWDAGSGTRFAVFAAFEKRGLKPFSIIESGNTEFIKDMVKRGKGYSFLASICVRNEINRGELATVHLRGEEIGLDIDIIHFKGKTLSPAAATFIRFLQESSDLKDPGSTVDGGMDRGKTLLPMKVAVAGR
jgi:DNA-binding transcriptional LysR family regulator